MMISPYERPLSLNIDCQIGGEIKKQFFFEKFLFLLFYVVLRIKIEDNMLGNINGMIKDHYNYISLLLHFIQG